MIKTIKTYSRPAKFAELKDFCPFAKDNDYIEITEWYNGEGFDVSISEEKNISLTWGEWELIQKLVSYEEPVDYKVKYHSNKMEGTTTHTITPVLYSDLSTCPRCGGVADNGFDRSYPPVPYICTKCEVDIFATPG